MQFQGNWSTGWPRSTWPHNWRMGWPHWSMEKLANGVEQIRKGDTVDETNSVWMAQRQLYFQHLGQKAEQSSQYW
jgi:hypothetical protein